MSKESHDRDAVPDLFGRRTFNENVMRNRMLKANFKELQQVIKGKAQMTPALADAVAAAMKDWALEQGATHFCHWFQPLSGETAEKHDSFINPINNGTAIMEFSGKELSQGEPDASSLPSGSLRSTFEARGYTAWDCTSPVFVKSDGSNTTLFIPSAFCSFTGHALDTKTPLLRSMDALNKQALRIIRAFGDKTATSVTATMGAEQEYFLVDLDLFDQRLDLMLTGRTLFGASPPKGQEMDDHYFGHLHERVASFMSELNNELWSLGVTAKTQHNEVAPSQYELAPVFTTLNVACDQNQLVMETLEKVAARHNFVCLLHEKPFAGVNGSGKHNNWSMSTDTGINLLEPGKTPHENAVFLTFLCAIIRAVDRHASLLRASVATAANDHRLGANEAPPAIISVFLGTQLQDIMDQLARSELKSSTSGGNIELGVSSLPPLPKDSTDRNRTSPFAFTGQKFEFRMPGSSQTVANPCTIINTIVADVLAEFAAELEKCADLDAVHVKATALCSDVARNNSRVIMNGNNYSDEWKVEAAKRGLPNLDSTPRAVETIYNDTNIALFERTSVLSAAELEARAEIQAETYIKTINIEALTSINMVKKVIRPAALRATKEVADAASSFKAIGLTNHSAMTLARTMGELLDQLDANLEGVESAHGKTMAMPESSLAEMIAKCYSCRDDVLTAMDELRRTADELEMVTDAGLWPLPSYATMLFHKSTVNNKSTAK